MNTHTKKRTPKRKLSLEENINSKMKSFLTKPLVKSRPERQIKHKRVWS
jgi:hypothetical protein